MPDKKLRFAIFGNEFQPKKSASIQKMLSVLRDHGAQILIDKPFFDFLQTEHIGLDGTAFFEGDNFDADFVVSMGGDGTFLKAAGRVGEKNIPLIGVNMGRLGFLSDTMPSEIEKAVDYLYGDDYQLEHHTVICVDSDGEALKGSKYALNDIAILKRDTAAMISIRTSVDGEYFVTYQADGLVISTPTGSTAYNLSNGGPLMAPNTSVVGLTPVAPHSLNIRPIVIDDSSVITIKVESRSHNFLVAVDGRSETLSEGSTLTIRKAPYTIRTVKMPNKRYSSTLREKMMWGADSRN